MRSCVSSRSGCTADPSGDLRAPGLDGTRWGLLESAYMRPRKILEVNQFSKKDEEILGGARDRFERNEARGYKFMGELKPTHLFSVVSCQGQGMGGL